MLEQTFRAIPSIRVPERAQHESYVGSSIQFQVTGFATEAIQRLVAACLKRGVEIKWFGEEEPRAFTSRYDSWQYLGAMPELPKTLEVLARTCDLRVPLTFTTDDCRQIGEIIAEECAELAG